jgi:hypothetical protein
MQGQNPFILPILFFISPSGWLPVEPVSNRLAPVLADGFNHWLPIEALNHGSG